MNRMKRETWSLVKDRFCFKSDTKSLARALLARKGLISQSGVINFGHSLNQPEWLKEILNQGKVVRLSKEVIGGVALIY